MRRHESSTHPHKYFESLMPLNSDWKPQISSPSSPCVAFTGSQAVASPGFRAVAAVSFATGVRPSARLLPTASYSSKLATCIDHWAPST